MILKPLTNRQWRGYSYDELQEQQALNETRIMLQKKALKEKISTLTGKKITASDKPQTKFSKVFSYFEYVILGLNLFRKIRSVYEHFSKKKSA